MNADEYIYIQMTQKYVNATGFPFQSMYEKPIFIHFHAHLSALFCSILIFVWKLNKPLNRRNASGRGFNARL